MRIVVHGQDAFGKAVLEKLLARGENVVAVCCAPDKAGRPEDPMKVFAKEKGLPVHQPKSWKTPEALALMQSFDADLCMMAYVLLFVPQPVLDAPKLGTFQYHPSLLPDHRGPSSINWPIAMGKTKTGLTIFWPDEGLDEGPILLQKTVDIGPDETLGDVYFKKLFPLGVDAMMESLDLVKAGKAPKIDQGLKANPKLGSYESWYKKELTELDWSKSAADVYNTIRAANPAPGAWTTIKGGKVDIFDSARIEGAGKAGEVMAIGADGVAVAAKGGRILIKRVRAGGSQKIAAAEWAQTAGIKVGDIFEAPAPKAADTDKSSSGGKKVAVRSDIEIARDAKKKPIQDIGAKLGIPSEHLLPFGHDKAKISAEFIKSLEGRKDGKLILVTAINPTPAGEGKTTTTVGLGDGLNHIGKKAAICLREPSLGPCFGVKGGAAGGGYAQVVPMEDINLHFTGDFHAITSAHNLLSAMIDNHIYWGNEQGIDTRRVVWRRVMDMNDRALREIVVSLGGVANGFPREGGFDITVASEVMAILCLANDIKDLEKRLGDIIIAYRRDRTPVYARDIKADGAMTVLLAQAMQPNLVQTLENSPALIHGGPFANIAHGCNSVVATKAALKLADYVVTEAGFGADLGAEKFFDIKCRKAGLKPDAAVIVATVRALKMNGGVKREDLGKENVEAVKKGLANLGRHIENVKSFGVPAVVGINHFITDTDAEVAVVMDYVKGLGSECFLNRHWAEGGKGIAAMAKRVAEIADSGVAKYAPIYPDDMPLMEKIETIAKKIYRAGEVSADKSIRDQLATWEKMGYGKLPICIAKTQYSFSTDPNQRGAPTGHTIPVREVRLSAGAGFIVAICGEIMTMPGLPKAPSAEFIRFNDKGQIDGLF
jgi:formate--tetrahydrofolate ligase